MTTERKPRSLVTGGAGFLGSHVAQACLNMGHDVLVYDDLSGGNRHNVPKGATLQVGSICNADHVRAIFRDFEFDYVYHLAAYAAEGLSHFIRNFNYSNNVVGTMNLINESVNHNVKRFVFTSSIAVYGKGHPPFHEDDVPQPEDPYGVAKYAVEMDLKAAQHMFGLDYTIFRPHNVYGPHQNLSDQYRNVVGIFMKQAMLGLPLSIFGDGTQSRAFTYVDDVAPHIARSVEMPHARNTVFNVGADQVRTVKQLAEAVCTTFGVPKNFIMMPARNEVVAAFSDHSRTQSVFGPSRVDLESGLIRMAEWAKQAPSHRGGTMLLEIEKNLPEAWKCSR